MRRAPAVLLAMVASALLGGCGEELSSAEVLLSYDGFSSPRVGGLEGVRVLLHARDQKGRPARVRVKVAADGAEEQVLIESPVPMSCQGGQCALSFELKPGSYAFHIEVFAQDRCGAEARLVRLFPDAGALVSLVPRESRFLTFGDADFGFDDDGDGIENALEVAACGRFDVPDREHPPAACAREDHPCCAAPASDLAGRVTRFDGSDVHLGPDGVARAVSPFLLDSTEVTWGALERCVLAGACLVGKPDHPARRALAAPDLLRSLPAIGLTPAEAEEYCGWLDKGLPTDVQWDFAAAFRDAGLRARFPWDDSDPGDLVDAGDALDGGTPAPLVDAPAVGCAPTDPPPAANHLGSAGGCPDDYTPVGSYPQSYARRGPGPPVADLAGNAFEWTLEYAEDAQAPADARVPLGVRAVYLRGGSFESPEQLLENDFRLRITNFARDLDDFSAVAGFRCARALSPDEDAAEVEASYLPPEEPACGAVDE